MALIKFYIGTFGPFVYDDTVLINDPDGDFAGETFKALVTTGQLFIELAPTGPSEVARKSDLDALDGLAIVALLEALAPGDRLSHDAGLSDVSPNDHHTQGADTSVGALTVYANNAAAVAGGLAVNDLYRNGADPDLVCIVH